MSEKEAHLEAGKSVEDLKHSQAMIFEPAIVCCALLFIRPITAVNDSWELESHNSMLYVMSNGIDALSDDCLVVCLDLLTKPRDLERFRLISRRYCNVYRSFMRYKFQYLTMLFNETEHQQRIRSWSDIERDIPIIPNLQFQFFRGIDISTAYYELYWYHQKTKSPITRGISAFRNQPFLSMRLKATTSTGIHDTILVYVFEDGEVRKVYLYDELPHPRMLVFGLEDLDQLLSGQPISYHGKGEDRWLHRCWKLEDFALDARPTQYPLINFTSFGLDEETSCVTCICTNPFYCVIVPVIIMIVAVFLMIKLLSKA